ncbi:MAG: sulfatase, partial [Thermoprotei archaeon]|nr:sulfatase [Thermoprotei archaeon]
PNIDSFAKEATVFERAYAEGLPTLPVRTALLTGKYTLPNRGWQRLEPTDTSIAEILWDKGYRTALITDTYHMHKPGMGYSRGFDTVIWIRGQESDPHIVDPSVKVDLNKWHEKNWCTPQYSKNIERQKKSFIQYLKNRHWWRSEEDHFVARVFKAAAKWLEEQVKEGVKDRIFLWVDSFDPHEPWDPPEEYYKLYAPPEYQDKPIIWGGGLTRDFTDLEVRHIRAQYAGEVTLVDKWVGWFFNKLKELELWENTLIILLSDHGEPLGEHGIIKKVRPWPYEELARIVLIVKHPDGIGRNKRVNALVETVDILPTILDVIGINPEEKTSLWSVVPQIQGKSLLPLITGEAESVKPFAISGHYKRSWSIRTDDYVLYLWLPTRAEYQWGLEPLTDKFEKFKPELYKANPHYVPPPPKDYNWREDVPEPEEENLIDSETDIAQDLELKLRRKILSLLGYKTSS